MKDSNYASNCSNPEFIQNYLDQRNCLIEADSESCEKMSYTKSGAIGLSTGLGFYLYSKKHPSLHDGIKKIYELNEEMPKLVNEALEVKKAVNEKFKAKTDKFYEKLFEKYKEYPRFVEAIKQGRNYRPKATIPYDIANTVASEKINDEIKSFYDKNHKKEYLAQMKKTKNPIWSEFDSISRDYFVDIPYELDLFKDDEILKKYFGQDYKDYKNFQEKKYSEFEKEFLKKNPQYNEKSLNEVIKKNSGQKYRDKIVDSYFAEFNEFMDKAYASEPKRPFKFFSELSKRTLNKDVSAWKLKGMHVPYGKLSRPKFKNIAKSGIIGAFGGAAAEVVMNERAKYELKKCKNALSISDAELEFLNNGSTLFSGSKVKNEIANAPCSGFSLNNPEDLIAEAVDKFGEIPRGMCKIINKEFEGINDSISKSLRGIQGSCEEKKFYSKNVSLDFNKVNPEASILVERNEGTFKYVFPLYNGNSIPDLKSAKVYKKSSTGEFVSESRYSNDFMGVINKIFPSNLALDLGAPPETGFQSDSDKVKFAAERQRRYNSYFNQAYWNYSQGCKGYGNIECEVMESAFAVLPVVENAKKICGSALRYSEKDDTKKSSTDALSK